MIKSIPIGLICCISAVAANDQGMTDAFQDLKATAEIREGVSSMALPASQQEVEGLLKSAPEAAWLVFPEQRSKSLRSSEFLPKVWTQMSAAQRSQIKLEARPGEYMTYQLGVYAARQALANVRVEFSPLQNENGQIIEPQRMTCFNEGGIDLKGRPFKNRVDIPAGSVKALWIGVDVPVQATGTYRGKARVCVDGQEAQSVEVILAVSGEKLAEGGDSEGWRMSRLRWLNSSVGLADQPTAPYIPLKTTIQENSQVAIQYLGGSVLIGNSGLPASIRMRYNSANQLDPKEIHDVLAGAMRFVVETDSGLVSWKPDGLVVESQSAGHVRWKARMSGQGMALVCRGVFEFDGFSDISVELSSEREIQVRDVRLEIPVTTYAAKYFMGLGQRGGLFPENGIDWKWNVQKNHQDSFWIGNVNAGVRVLLKGDNYQRPLVNVYYKYGPLNLPESWGNEGKGGIRIAPVDQQNGQTLVQAFTGPRTLSPGKPLNFGMELLPTPVKPLDWKRQTSERYFQSNSDVSSSYIDQALNNGANIINIHHKKDIYPFINYPYADESVADFKQFIAAAHDKNLKVKSYYTTREISVKIPEIWAMRQLGGEIIMDGPGKEARTVTNRQGPHEWLNKNFGNHFIPAWHNVIHRGKFAGEMDLSVLTTPDSRWNNYYLEGLHWMVRHMGLDGIYIDDCALDHESMKRARRILDADGKRRMVDLHSWNHMNGWAGYANSVLMYADLFPFIDRLWIGEGFSPNSSPDFWMVEMSGIPFGLMSETLNSHNYWRGMVYGMTPRLGWSGNPTAIWKLYDQLKMESAQIKGYWDPSCPVSVDSPHARATAFVAKDWALVVVANWTNRDVQTSLSLNPALLGFPANNVSMPEMKGIQEGRAAVNLAEKPLLLKANQGAFLLIRK